MNPDSANTSKGNILVVDDLPDNLRVLSTTLVECGYKVRCVRNGEMALVSISHCPPNLILLDIRMPTMDGYEVCRQLKANPATKNIPIIFLSAADDVAGKVTAFEMGGVDYITKPFQTKEVLARITNQLTIQRLQNQLTEQNQRLQQEIDEHKQTELALQDAKDAAEAANYAKSKFIARMSHELRTPLNAILGFAALMKGDSSLTQEYQDYVDRISQSGEYLLKSINYILMMASAEVNQLSRNEHKFDLYQLVNAISSTWHPKAQAKGLQFLIEYAPGVPRHVYADETKLRQVLMNLLENALQFTQQGRVVLRVKVEGREVEAWRRGKDNHNASIHPPPPLPFHPSIPLIFEIEDTGSGIASDEMNEVFQVFSQTETGQKSGRGIGLGLFISRQFVQVMGGDITITSAPVQGTMVRFYILVHPAQSDLEQIPSSVQAGDRSPSDPIPTVASQPPMTEALMLEAMRVEMPITWLIQLQQAAIKGFDHQILQLIEELPATHAPLARMLTDWNQNFQFERIVTVTQKVLERTS